jgi:hypothetical protein
MPQRAIADLEKFFYGFGDWGWREGKSDYKGCFCSQKQHFLN